MSAENFIPQGRKPTALDIATARFMRPIYGGRNAGKTAAANAIRDALGIMPKPRPKWARLSLGGGCS